MLTVAGIEFGERSQRNVAAVAVSCVGGPPAEDSLATVGFADV